MTAGQTWSRSFASAGGEAMEIYDRIMVPRLFEPWGNLLLDTLGLSPGQIVLDVATGPGTVARLAAARVGPKGLVTGCDISAGMLSVARAKPAPEGSALIGYRECPADALDVADSAYDAVVCQQGLQFFPNRAAALAEMRRALRPGGSIGLACWAAIQECSSFEALAKAIGRVAGAQLEAAYRGGPWGLPDPNELEGLVRGAGFTNVQVTHHRLPLVWDGGPAQLVETLAASGIAAQVAALGDAGIRDLVAALADAARSLLEGEAIRSEAAAHIVTASA